MKKGVMFEAVITLMLLLLIFAMYVMVAGSAPRAVSGWNVTIGTQAPYLYAGANDTLYVFSGNDISSIASDGTVRWSLSAPQNWTIVNERTIYPIEYPTDLFFHSRVYTLGRYNQLVENMGFRPESEPAVASSDGVLYVYLRPDFYFGDNKLDGNISLGLERALGPDWNSSPSYARLMAISSDGRILWNKPLDNGMGTAIDTWLPIEDVFVSVSNDRIYVYHPFSLTVLDTNGDLIFRIDNVSRPAAVDEQGDIYTVKTMERGIGHDKIPSESIIAYYPNGTVWWQKGMSGPLRSQSLDENVNPGYKTLPIYRNGTLYVPLEKSLAALYPNGTERWSISSKWDVSLLPQMPFDSQNNVYMTINTEPILGSDWIYYQGTMVAPNGTASNFTIQQYTASLDSANDGIGYSIHTDNWADSNGNYRGPSRLSDLITWNIMASDFRTGKDMWNFTIPTGDQNVVTLNPSNVKYLDEMMPVETIREYYGYIFSTTANATIGFNKDHPQLQNLSKGQIGDWAINGAGTISLLPEDHVLYVSYYMSNYEYPNVLSSEAANSESDRYYRIEPVFNRSRLAYVSGVLAIDNKGRMLWNKPTDSLVTAMAANNSTVYYSTKDGKLFATQSNLALGFALIAVAYLFLRFFCVGAVARARSRIDKNDNRNSVMKYVIANPGSTLRDISRGMRMNLGTVRYHIFILGLNHRIVTYQSDGKHVCYFINSGTYTREEQLVLSVMRREGMRKILGTLLNRPGLSNVELSSEVGLQESAVSRYMKELAEKGLVVKELAPMGSSSYFLANERRAHVAKAMEIMKGQ
jgi:predicted transcriptional regulator